MINLVEFERVAHDVNDWKEGKVFIAPTHVVRVERADEIGFETGITLASGHSEIVLGAPSEVIARLRKGA